MQLEDIIQRMAIKDQLATYCARLDEYDIDAVAQIFVTNCVSDYGPQSGGRVEGRAALRERILTSQARFERTCHTLGQVLIDVSGGTASSMAYTTAWHKWRHAEGTWWVYLRYLDDWVRHGATWQIEHRRVEACGAEGWDAEYNWVERRMPVE